MGIGSYDSVAPGEPFKPSSRVWNEFVVAARRASETKFGSTGAGISAAWGAPCNVVRVRNDTGLALGPHRPIKPSGVLGKFSEEPLEFSRYPLFTGVPVFFQTDVIWITLEHIPNDGIGRVAVSGVTLAYVTFAATTDLYARATNAGNLQSLNSSSGATARVLVAPSGTGERLVPVLLQSW